MLNNRQREFRKRMKEAEAIKQNQEDVYSYRDQRFGSEKLRKRFRKPLLQIGGIVSLLVLLWNLYAFSSFLIPWGSQGMLLSNSQSDVHQYIQKSARTELALSELVNSLIGQYNENSLTVLHIEERQEELFDLQKKNETNDSRFLPMKAYMDGQFSLAYQVMNVLKTEDSNAKYLELNRIVVNQIALSAQRNKAMIAVLESENIDYNQLEDGTISYEYER